MAPGSGRPFLLTGPHRAGYPDDSPLPPSGVPTTRLRRSASALAVLAMLVALPAAAPASAPHMGSSAHDRTVAHWTTERMQSAVPRDFVRSAPGPLRPLGKPGSGGGTVTGAPWPNGQGLAYRATGKVFFEMSGVAYVCSGSVVTDSRVDRSLVLTAAHCAYDEVADTWAEYWMFVPQYDSAPTTD